MNITHISTILLAVVNPAVIPKLKPAVPNADITSKEIFSRLTPESNCAINAMPSMITTKDKVMIANALRTETSEISLLNISIFAFPLAKLKTLSTAKPFVKNRWC